MLLEFCAENFTHIPHAIEKGAHRIELCDNLAAGGTTPSYAVIEHSLEYGNRQDIPVMTMIRPRGGNFVYSPVEFQMMRKDLIMAKNLDSNGVVFGCLTQGNRIDRLQTKELLKLSDEMETVFHMAFDRIPQEYQKEELEWLIEQDVTRLLTRGAPEGDASKHIEWLKELIDYADGRIEIVVGGGVTHENVTPLAEWLPTNQFHGTKIVDLVK